MRTFVCRYGLDVNGTPHSAAGAQNALIKIERYTGASGSAVSGEWIKDAVPDRLVTVYKYCATEELQSTL